MERSTHKLLLVEDDLNLGFVIKDQLESHEFVVDWATKGRDGLKKALSNDYDLAILDVMLPELGGFELAEEIVDGKPELSFMFLTAKSMLDDKVKGLKLGKDYLTKPFEFEELLQRLRNMMMNSDKKEKVSEVQFEIGSYHFDYINQYLEKDGDRQKLTKKEADLLRLLAMNENEVMNREQALKAIWGSDDYFNGRSMDVFISKLRKYLKKDEHIQILNVHGVGFKLITNY